ncbi:MAG TPA: PAS domain S-box protein [Flavisolibacter sp.]|nr:PAS domain S-box protein [Flavisolibacter sp.]
MKKLNQLLIIEAGSSLEPLAHNCQSILQLSSVSTTIEEKTAVEVEATSEPFLPELVLWHSNLTNIEHLQQFIKLQSRFSYSTVIIVTQDQDEELSLLAIEAGAEDCVTEANLTKEYIRKAVVVSRKRIGVEKESAQSREQLLACLQNTPNVAVQWYNSQAEVLFWNKASEAIFGWTAEEAIGKTLNELIDSPENVELWLNKIRGVTVPTTLHEPQEWSFRHRDGTEGFCISTMFSISSVSGEPRFVCMDVEISNRKQMEKALQESEQRYRTLFSQASDAIFISDNKGKFLEVNQRACELLGYSQERLLSMTIPDLYTEEELVREPIMWEELWAGERTSMEREAVRSDGTMVPIHVTAQMFDDKRIMAIMRDISEHRQASEALRQSEERYRSLIEQQADAITIFDRYGQIQDANTSAVQMLQYAKNELRGMTLADILLEEDIKNDPVGFTNLEQGVATIKQRRLRRKDGSLIETEVNAKHLWDGLFIASVRDLTERVEVQRQLEKEIELSHTIINSLPGLFYLYKKDGTFLRWNKQFEEISGYTAEEFKTMSPLDFFSGEEVNLVFKAIEKVFETGQWNVEAHLMTKDGRQIPYYFTGTSINYAGAACLLGTGIDLSVAKNLEQELSREKIVAQKKLMHAMLDAEEKEKVKLGLELHDNISQILSVVRMYLAILDSGQVPEGVTLLRTIQLLDTAIDEIRNLSHNLAIRNKFETGLTEALNDMIDKVRLTRDFSIDFIAPPELDQFLTSHQKIALYRIIQEQLNNIIKYAKASAVAVHINVTDNQIQLTISDNGKGFDPLKVEKGLGLNNITNRTEALGGKVIIQSAPGEGCQVVVQIPIQT